MIVKDGPMTWRWSTMKRAMTGLALGLAVIAYLVPTASSAFDRDKVGAEIGRMHYVCPRTTSVRDGYLKCDKQFRDCVGSAKCAIHAERCMRSVGCTFVDQ